MQKFWSIYDLDTQKIRREKIGEMEEENTGVN